MTYPARIGWPAGTQPPRLEAALYRCDDRASRAAPRHLLPCSAPGRSPGDETGAAFSMLFTTFIYLRFLPLGGRGGGSFQRESDLKVIAVTDESGPLCHASRPGATDRVW